ncbi:PAS domain-containing protein [bacterium]|nr:PAS domain-containing protein [bacterium]
MRLRARLLMLIALVVSAALGAYFWVIYSAVRSQTLTDLDRSLRVAENVWLSLSKSQAQSLVAAATGMAGEAGFVRVLRGTDPATLLDYLKDAQKNNPALDVILICDDQGKARARTDGVQEALPWPDPLLEAALEGQVGAAFWTCPSGLYMAAASPIYRRGDVVEGVLLLGICLDQEFVSKLSRDTATQVALLPNQGQGSTTLDGLGQKATPSLHTLLTPLADFSGQPVGKLVLARDIDSALRYLSDVNWQLAGLGLGVLALACVVSLPLLGRMTNPVVLLEKAQAEMDAVFQADLDGLVALDQAGHIVTANPAAAVCLGLAVEKLPGRSLEELMPPDVFSQLIAVQPSSGQLVQRGQWQREGRRFQLTRTFVASKHVGSVLVTRDCSHEIVQSQHHQDFLGRLREALQHRPEDQAGWLRWERERGNLLCLAGDPPPQGAAVADLRAELATLLDELKIPAQIGPDLPKVDLGQGHLRLLMLNLLGCTGFQAGREGGGCWLIATGLTPSDWETEALTALLQDEEGRLEREGPDLKIWLPAALC